MGPESSELALGSVTSCVTLGILLNFSEPQFLICKMGIIINYSQVSG